MKPFPLDLQYPCNNPPFVYTWRWAYKRSTDVELLTNETFFFSSDSAVSDARYKCTSNFAAIARIPYYHPSAEKLLLYAYSYLLEKELKFRCRQFCDGCVNGKNSLAAEHYCTEATARRLPTFTQRALFFTRVNSAIREEAVKDFYYEARKRMGLPITVAVDFEFKEYITSTYHHLSLPYVNAFPTQIKDLFDFMTGRIF